MFTYNTCYIQYVGEIALPLHKRINIHQTAKLVVNIWSNIFKNDCAGSSFSIQILEIFEEDGYVNDKV